MSCHGCGVQKDPNVDVKYPYPEEDGITDEPVSPFFELECQPRNDQQRWKKATVCHECFHKLSPDMWIGEWCWEAIKPVVAFNDLPDNEWVKIDETSSAPGPNNKDS